MKTIPEKSIWEPFAMIVALLASIILWLKWLGEQVFTIDSVISTAIIWFIIVIILVIGSQLIGWLSSILAKSLPE